MKYVYVLENFIHERPVLTGIFTSLAKAEAFLKRLPKKYEYTIYKLLINTNLTKGRKLEDQRGIFDHWHYGTYVFTVYEDDERGNLVKKKREEKGVNMARITWAAGGIGTT